MKLIRIALLTALLLLPVTAAKASSFEWNQSGYNREEATGFLRNATGKFQGSGGGTGLTT